MQRGTGYEEIGETIDVAVLLLGGSADVWPVQIIEEKIQKYMVNRKSIRIE